MAEKHTFNAEIMQSDETGAGAFVLIPENVMTALGAKRVKVFCEFDGEPYRGTALNMGLGPCIGILKEIRGKIGKQKGDTVRVVMWKDELERTVDVPEELRTALIGSGAESAFNSLSYTRKKQYASKVGDAKREETKKRRIAEIISELVGKLELVIFDMDGLMFGTEQIAIDAWHEVLPLYGYAADDKMILSLLGRNVQSVKERFESFYSKDFPFDDINARRIEVCDRVIETHGIPVKPGLYSLLDMLDEKGIKKAVATSTARRKALSNLSKAGIETRFDTVVCGNEVVRSKPEPDIFLEAASRLVVNPVNCVVLEDSENGIRAAHAAGMRPILVPDVVRPPGEAIKLAYAECKTLSEVVALLRGFWV